MKEKSIVLTTEEVKAVLGRRKKMFRVPIKPQPPKELPWLGWINSSTDKKYEGKACWSDDSGISPGHYVKCPWQIEDILWVRETWERLSCCSCDGDWRGICCSEPDENEGCYMYRSTHEITGDARWHSSTCMPRAAARIFLKVTNVRVERLREITVEDVIAEGIDTDNDIRNPDPATHEGIRNWNYQYAQFQFKELWDSINAKRGYGWDKSPWVWVVEFERAEAKV